MMMSLSFILRLLLHVCMPPMRASMHCEWDVWKHLSIHPSTSSSLSISLPKEIKTQQKTQKHPNKHIPRPSGRDGRRAEAELKNTAT
ncbi:hypothetical protein IWX90DRAFT_445455 [Phyllosticta citrichinensis]|uniref:Secreted protein n=1 Tax=Phyllosticta citrichinensis TaxID=1130410 RepID=A0ABR1XG36_9PEZI